MRREFHIERIKEALEELKAFDSCPLADMVLLKDGEPIQITHPTIKKWEESGLKNSELIAFECWIEKSVISWLLSRN